MSACVRIMCKHVSMCKNHVSSEVMMQWIVFTHTYTHTHTTLFNAATLVLYNAVFILANAFFTFVDITGRPSFMLQYKIQEDKNVPVRKTNRQTLTLQKRRSLVHCWGQGWVWVKSSVFVDYMYVAVYAQTTH